MCKTSDNCKAITSTGVCDAVLKADEKATGEKAASALDLRINCWHVRLPIGQAETQSPTPLLKLEDKCGLYKKESSSTTATVGLLSIYTAHFICHLTLAHEVANMALSHREKINLHSQNPAQQSMQVTRLRRLSLKSSKKQVWLLHRKPVQPCHSLSTPPQLLLHLPRQQ